MNYYDVLGVKKNATQDEIKKAFRELSKKYHPDKNNGDDRMFKKINEAYDTLGDNEKKKIYDMEISGWNGNFRGFQRLAQDVKTKVTISMENAYNGCNVQVNVNMKKLSVEIPKGTTDGKLLKIPGMGIAGVDMYGRETSGDLIVLVNVQGTDTMWINDNGLLEVMKPVEWIDAILGSEMTIDIFGRSVKFRIPKFTQNGGYTIVGKQGFRKFKSDELGNLKVDFIVKMPKNLTDEQMGLLKKIKESL